MNGMRPIHPGEVLREEFGALGDVPGIAPDRFDALKREELRLRQEDAASLAEALGTTVGFWLNLQAQFDARST